jgi:hypothetical protein
MTQWLIPEKYYAASREGKYVFMEMNEDAPIDVPPKFLIGESPDDHPPDYILVLEPRR